jgi:hypothetical protein
MMLCSIVGHLVKLSYVVFLLLRFFFQGDVIVSFDGISVGNEATVPFRSAERIAFRYLVSQK